MESLLTAVEFVIEDSTMTNLTAEDSTTDVTDNNPTATITLTAEDSTADVEKDNDDWWIFTWTFLCPKYHYWKDWKMKGITRTAWTLIIGPHTFHKHRGKNDHISYFSLLGDKKTITAISEHEFGEDEHGTVGKFTSGGQPRICSGCLIALFCCLFALFFRLFTCLIALYFTA